MNHAAQLTGQTTYRVTDIQWDTDGDTSVDLPTEMEVIAENEDAVGDTLSDLTGYCHFGFKVEPANEAPTTNQTGDDGWQPPKAALNVG